MNIHALICCVNYAHHLEHALPRWIEGCESVTIVTSIEDSATRALCERYCDAHDDLFCYSTNAFTINGASFNKGLAMEQARESMPWRDWVLFADADIVPPEDWHLRLDRLHEGGQIQFGSLYGLRRRHAVNFLELDNPLCPVMTDDRVGYGYFQLFHAKDPRALRAPLLDTHWKHAGNYDSNFLLSFGRDVKELPFHVWHLGDKHENWFGVGKEREFEEMMRRRNGRGVHPSEDLRMG